LAWRFTVSVAYLLWLPSNQKLGELNSANVCETMRAQTEKRCPTIWKRANARRCDKYKITRSINLVCLLSKLSLSD
jgi:hypothetical protein